LPPSKVLPQFNLVMGKTGPGIRSLRLPNIPINMILHYVHVELPAVLLSQCHGKK